MNVTNKNPGCCKCNQEGLEVGYDTVFNLTNDYIRNTLEDEKFYLCINASCDIAYYTSSRFTINVNQLIKPIWFKNNKNQFIVCYCRDISINDVIFAVNSLSEPINISKVVHFLQKNEIEISCLHHNPTGMSCEKLFLNAIEYGKKIKKMKEGEN
jgi:hypothetical protein